MIRKPYVSLIYLILIVVVFGVNVFGRAAIEVNDQKQFENFSAAGNPAYELVGHRIGQIVLALNNNGTFGTGFASGVAQDAITGQSVPSCEYPRSSNISYLFAGAFWIGAVVGRDTLVSVAADGWSSTREFAPESERFGGKIKKKSILFPDVDTLYEGAVSEEDFIMSYRDTITDGVPPDVISNRAHKPLNIEVEQRSFAWSYPYAEDFVLFDYQITNIGFTTLEKVYMGIYVDGDVGSTTGPSAAQRHTDDISGFIETRVATFRDCEFIDTVNIAWLADNDGDPLAGTNFDDNSPTSVTGTRIIRTPADKLEVSFNWWVSDGNVNADFGPRERDNVGKLKEKVRDLKTGGLGTPEGDNNKYYFMRNREFDYDQYAISTITATDPLWLYPDQDLVTQWATGLDTRYLLSFGPFNINPGEKLPVSFAYVGGENFHVNPQNLQNILDGNVDTYYDNLNFAHLTENASWADRVYDNPGIDTDGDGDKGDIWVCCDDSARIYDTLSLDPIDIDSSMWEYDLCDTMYYRGDGVPDFQGASPPPAPKIYLEPTVGSVRVRFNGLLSETTPDVFSDVLDFEGYRVYVSRDDRESSYSLVESYDKENFNKYTYNFDDDLFELLESPFGIEDLQCLYGDSCGDNTFNPLNYTRSAPYVHPLFADSVFYFEAQDFNVSELGVTTRIRKVYPNEPYPSEIIPDSADASELTPDGDLKYFEYEITITDLLPTVPYYFNVTAFDFGSPESGLSALETNKANGAKLAYPHNTAESVQNNDHEVYVFPNPYRIDAGYQTDHFERERDRQTAADRIRALHFMNLPPKCTVRIFSIDGDMIREIKHDKSPTDPTSGHLEWDLITRNTQLTVSGLYYWSVEDENGNTQIGKFVIIM